MARSAYTPPSNSKFYWLPWFEGCSMEIMALQISILRIIQLWYFKIRWESLYLTHTTYTTSYQHCKLQASSGHSLQLLWHCSQTQLCSLSKPAQEQQSHPTVQSCTSASWAVWSRSNRGNNLKSYCRSSISCNVILQHSLSSNVMIS